MVAGWWQTLFAGDMPFPHREGPVPVMISDEEERGQYQSILQWSSRRAAVIEEYVPRTTKAEAISLLVNSAVGAGILSFPYAWKAAGAVGGAIVLVVIGCMQCFTLTVLSSWAESTNAKSYGELVRLCIGTKASIGLNVSMFLYLFGSGVAYLIILGDSFTPILHNILELCGHSVGDQWWETRQFVILVVSVIGILPVCLKKRLGDSAMVSVLNMVAFIAIVVSLVGVSVAHILMDAHRFEDVDLFPDGIKGLMKAIPICVFAFQCHAQVISVYNELEDSTAAMPTYLSFVFRPHKKREEEEEEHLQHRSNSAKLVAMTDVIVKSSTFYGNVFFVYL